MSEDHARRARNCLVRIRLEVLRIGIPPAELGPLLEKIDRECALHDKAINELVRSGEAR